MQQPGIGPSATSEGLGAGLAAGSQRPGNENPPLRSVQFPPWMQPFQPQQRIFGAAPFAGPTVDPPWTPRPQQGGLGVAPLPPQTFPPPFGFPQPQHEGGIAPMPPGGGDPQRGIAQPQQEMGQQPNIAQLLQTLFMHFGGQRNMGTPAQQMQGGHGMFGGNAGRPYGMFGSFYAPRMAQMGVNAPGIDAPRGGPNIDGGLGSSLGWDGS